MFEILYPYLHYSGTRYNNVPPIIPKYTSPSVFSKNSRIIRLIGQIHYKRIKLLTFLKRCRIVSKKFHYIRRCYIFQKESIRF